MKQRDRQSSITQADTAEIFPILKGLVDGWCERRALGPLRIILQVYPLVNPLTDGWQDLYDGLRDARSSFRDELPEDEQERLHRAILLTQFVLDAPR
jgi:hypothetical protein